MDAVLVEALRRGLVSSLRVNGVVKEQGDIIRLELGVRSLYSLRAGRGNILCPFNLSFPVQCCCSG